jgi:NDP-sugar pyrophosphorylase family protein
VADRSYSEVYERLSARAKSSKRGRREELAGMRAVILAGGRGTRLAPYTSVLPKPLMPVGERSILEIVLRQLSASGVTSITLCVGYLSHLIRAVIDDNAGSLVEVEYVHEDEPLGTAAPLKLVDGLDETFLVMNGDVLTTLDYRDLVRRHRETGSALTIATHERKVTIDYGIVHADEDDRIVGFEEKPEISAAVSMGVYVMEPEVLEHIPGDGHADFPDLVKALLEAGRPVSSYRYSGLWFDIGRHDDFQQAVAAWATVNGTELPGAPYIAPDHVAS